MPRLRCVLYPKVSWRREFDLSLQSFRITFSRRVPRLPRSEKPQRQRYGATGASSCSSDRGNPATARDDRNALVQRIAVHVKNARILVALASRLDTPPAAASAAAVAAAAARVKAKEAEARRESAEGGTVTGSNDPVAAEASIDDYLDEENLRQQTPDAEVLPREWRVADGAPVYVRDRSWGGGLSDGYVSPSNGARDAGNRYQHRGNEARRRGSTRSENRGPVGPASMPEAGASSADRLQGQMRWREITKQPLGLVVLVDIGNELRGGPRVLLGMPEYGIEEQEAARREGRKSGGLYIDPSMAEYCLLLSIYFGERHFFIYAWMDWRADLVVSRISVFVPRRLHH